METREKQAQEDRKTITIKPISNAVLVRIGWVTESFPTWDAACKRVGQEIERLETEARKK